MSYTLNVKAPKGEIGSVAAEAIAGHQLAGEAADEARQHLDAVAQVVPALAAAIGVDADEIGVSITGHANPDHGKVVGWSDEHITITVAVSR